MDPFSDAGMSLRPLEGGWSGETFLAEAGGERSVVRIYARPSDRGAAAHEIDAALLRLVRGLVPVPRVLEVRRADAASGAPALLVTEHLPGTRGDLLLPTLDEDGLRRAGAATGRIAATLAGMPQLRAGSFVDGDLTVRPFEADGLPAWVEDAQARLRGWSAAELTGLRRVAEDAQALLDTVERVSLAHSDLNSKNLLLDPVSLRVTGVLDWEYAHAGHPFTDLGNLLRLDRHPAYVEAVLGAWTERHETPPDRALDLARSADLVALLHLAVRAGENPVATAADRQLRAVATTGDVHAVP
ncbi:phosphotransferase family protein [Nocardioides pantholopis]|uniref:phosphotransferase family protein n=1 Tax=Nocardioides pantholopis TaxID=2483798 RepID=UPI001F49DF9F|nr:phosphotransferase [Nocardioides pantholopis]